MNTGFSFLLTIFIASTIATTVAVVAHSGEPKEPVKSEWEKFSEAHGCQVIGRMDATGGSELTMTMSGKMALVDTSVPAKIGYKCNDGLTYWR